MSSSSEISSSVTSLSSDGRASFSSEKSSATGSMTFGIPLPQPQANDAFEVDRDAAAGENRSPSPPPEEPASTQPVQQEEAAEYGTQPLKAAPTWLEEPTPTQPVQQTNDAEQGTQRLERVPTLIIPEEPNPRRRWYPSVGAVSLDDIDNYWESDFNSSLLTVPDVLGADESTVDEIRRMVEGTGRPVSRSQSAQIPTLSERGTPEPEVVRRSASIGSVSEMSEEDTGATCRRIVPYLRLQEQQQNEELLWEQQHLSQELREGLADVEKWRPRGTLGRGPSLMKEVIYGNNMDVLAPPLPPAVTTTGIERHSSLFSVNGDRGSQL